jgi:acetolactate synthase-1/2/3 large subunit
MKLSDYVVDFLVNNQIDEIFTVSGGGIAHLLDSVGRNPKMRYYCNYHEQACAIAAEGYARVTGKMGAVLVTVGPGAVNALSGIVGAWYDSIPMIVISGQVRSDLIADYTKVRQKGPQEGNVIAMAQPVTKYVVSVRDPSRIRYELEKAVYLACSGRPGPVWVEIPFDIQGANVDVEKLGGFVPEAEDSEAIEEQIRTDVARLKAAIQQSRRPLIVAGNGVRIGHSRKQLLALIEQLKIPAVVHAMAKDVLSEDHPQYVGVFGTAGQRRANFAVQNCDLLIVLGASLGVTKIGFNYAGFAPKAKKAVVNIDPGQVSNQALVPDIGIVADLRPFLDELLVQTKDSGYQPSPKWTEACQNWKKRYPIVLEEYFQNREVVNSYVLIDRLSTALPTNVTMVAGNGLDVVSVYQAFKVREGQRVFYSGNWGSMGWDLPLSVGACFGSGRNTTVLVTGDGSIMLNSQELLTIKNYKLPMKLFILNNDGYASIRATQNALFEGRLVGADPSSGVATIDWSKLAALYDFGYECMQNNDAVLPTLERVLATPGPVICEVKLSKDQVITPKASAFRRPDGTLESRPLEDMAPFLPREEIHENMHLFDDDKS